MNLLQARREAESLGITCEPVHRTGEWRFRHPSQRMPVTVNMRRKEAPHVLEKMIRNVRKVSSVQEEP